MGFAGRALISSQQTPNELGFQLANTCPKITGHGVYAMVRNGKEPENLDFSSVAATFETATYVFAGRLIRNAEVRGSIPLCSTNNSHTFNSLLTHSPVTSFPHVAKMWTEIPAQDVNES